MIIFYRLFADFAGIRLIPANFKLSILKMLKNCALVEKIGVDTADILIL